MAKELKAGDQVSWSSDGSKAHGKVVKKVTSPMTIRGHKVAASADNPEYLVDTDEGKQAAHKAEPLTSFDANCRLCDMTPWRQCSRMPIST